MFSTHLSNIESSSLVQEKFSPSSNVKLEGKGEEMSDFEEVAVERLLGKCKSVLGSSCNSIATKCEKSLSGNTTPHSKIGSQKTMRILDDNEAYVQFDIQIIFIQWIPNTSKRKH